MTIPVLVSAGLVDIFDARIVEEPI